MSLPPILRYVYNHGTEEVIRRGKKIFYSSGVQMLDVDHLLEQVRFRVRNDQYQNYYTVTINKYLQTKDLAVRCQCPYNLGEICRHEVAALFQLNDILQSGFFENVNISYDQKHTVVRMRQVSRQMLQLFAAPETIEKAELVANGNRAIIVNNKNGNIEADVPGDGTTWRVTIKQNEDRYFDTSCGCAEHTHPLCLHKTILFLQVLKNFGPHHFQSIQNWDIQKNKLLEQYGYSLKDDLKGKFEFIYQDNKPFLRVLDPTIKKVNAPQPLNAPAPVAAVAAPVVKQEEKRLGVVFDTTVASFPFVEVLLVAGSEGEDEHMLAPGIEKLELSQYVNPMRFMGGDRDLLPVIRKFQPDELLRYLKKTLPFGDFLHDYESLLKDIPQEEVRSQAWEYLLPKYQKLVERYNTHPYLYTRKKGKTLSSQALEPVGFSSAFVHPQLVVRQEGKEYIVEMEWNMDNKAVPFKDVTIINPALLIAEHCIYAVGDLQEIALIEKFEPSGKMKVSAKKWNAFLKDELMEWSKMLHVHFSEELVQHVQRTNPGYKLYLFERDQTLMLQPAFMYEEAEIKPSYFGDVIQPHNGIVAIMKRNETAEREFLDLLQSLHTDIVFNRKEDVFYLPANSVLANNWFFRFADVMREKEVEVLGLEGLKNLRINTHKPQTQIQVSSGIDWFDASVELTFGEQRVSIVEVKKALSQKQNFVRLADGSLGLLPEEWLKKYSLLLKMGETKGSKIRLKKYHYNVLEELLNEIDEESLLEELEVKRERLEKIMTADFSNVAPPEHLSATLRPYQVAGFQWFIFLNEVGWGGILADDMGLGKTVQTLAFFQHYKNENPEAKFLVVCPTTLMYNWENEIKKFTPLLTHVIHHGPKRNPSPVTYTADIIITTYGTMRSDIKSLREITFDYVVLDESQSIKNPQSQVAKASLLLNCKNRLALSGTPVQNNTFDLYAQMNFLNPGMLGSREFFMSEFATPIDKFMEDEVKQQLRKLTYPFLLRRTKEQVAKDLPEKTETILYCEMGPDQRRIYDAYRNTYRSQILGMIEEQGMERSQMHILQGLTKLRQICDSPAILNESERFHNYSVKLDELSREITENVGDHKVLIFSQFLGMLALIREKLTADNISHVYFDGSSSSAERERAINEFQNNHDCRVFLISLKAGGIGLNLTAADYVYIVDPWWNPAVEQQAIDRTHRIGQTKNIFAYRLICKDTLEEKMLQLQERKRALAADLVSDDSTFTKRLTKDDIAFLFS